MERTIPYGRFALVEPRGTVFGYVLIAPEYVLLQRAAHTSIRDVSYLVVWSSARIASVTRELATMITERTGVVDATTRELHAMLHAIAPATTPLFLSGGDCVRTLRALVRRQLDSQLRVAATQMPVHSAIGRRAS